MDPIKIIEAALVSTNILDDQTARNFHCTPKSGRKKNQAQYSMGGFCVVFPMISNSGNEKRAYRIWYIDNLNHQMLKTARLVAEEIKKTKLPYFVGYEFIEEAISVEGKRIPGVKMDWIEGEKLDDYIRSHADPSQIRSLAGKFRSMCEDFSKAGISHGDLSNSNILVTPSGDIRLVDYDSMYFPAMKGKGYMQTTFGQPAFQHPKRRTSGTLLASSKDDNFSQLVIYLSLLAMAADSSLIHGISEEELIFNNIDLQSRQTFRESKVYKRFSDINDNEIQRCLSAIEKSLDGPLESIPSLVDVLEAERAKPSSTKFKNTTFCPICGTKYYLSSSCYCYHCGHKRK
jgi:serine/threonine protein kinase